ncbi:uncharacterized protein LOC133314917 [Gastrolobium bilobum]|uniref:uncharacterized protein LOC133314917 n=1 Tax=Gastrolobium bilobum TaxID=150636 RepID=UPI002AB2B57E|nr:uncharacterized protein LOC133314917 [Gastrolobium bilobum]
MVSGEQNVATMKMRSPTIKQSASDTNLSRRHNFRSKSSSSKTVRRPKQSNGRSLSSVNLQPYDIYGESSNSPYYKGLTDQSLAVSSCPAPHSSTSNLLPSGHSPYYKGLTDYSLVIDSWSPVLQNNPANNSLPHECSPYYRGLIDYSLALHRPQLSPPKIKNHSTLEELMTKMVDDDVAFLTEEKPLREKESEAIKVGSVLEENAKKTIVEEIELMTKEVIEEKSLRERVSEASIIENNVLEEKTDKIILEEMELMTKGVDDCDVGLEIKEKPSRDRRVSEASKVESVLEGNAEKTILELMTKEAGDGIGDVGLVIEKKPLRERVSEASNVEKVLQENAEKDKAEEGKLYEYLWATKYQPMTLADFICNRDTALQLKELVKEGCGCNHFIFEGPPSAGKRSMIRAMLREVFGADRVQVIEECKDFNWKGEMIDNLQVRINKSLHHVEVNLSETKGYEKHVIVDLFKETYGKIINNSMPCTPENCQAIILYEAEKLSRESLLYIKWLLEKYKGCNKVFFCCSDGSKLQLVKPLCTIVRLSSPSSQEIVKILEYIGKEEGIKLSPDLVKKIILRSRNNLRQAIRSLEATCRNKDSLKDDDLVLTGWEDDILNIAKNIIEEQSPRQLYVIRRKLQSLMIHDVAPGFIYKSLVAGLTSLVDDSLRSGVAKLDKEYNKASEIKFETMKQFGHVQNKQVESDERNKEPTKKNTLSYLKVEEFIAKFMSWYKNSSVKSGKHVQLFGGTL